MRTSASFTTLVALMAVAGTTAAPIGVNPGSGRAVSRVSGQYSRSIVPVSGYKLSNRHSGPVMDDCSCKPVSTGDAKSLAVDIDGKVEGMGKTVQDEIHVPDTHAHVDIDVNKGGDKPHHEPHPEPQPQPQPHPQPQPQPQPQPEPHPQPEPQPQPQPQPEPQPHPQPLPVPHPEPHPADDCLDPTKIHEGIQANACLTVILKDGKEGLDSVHDGAHKTGDAVEVKAGMVLDHVHNTNDKSMNAAHDAEKGALIVGKVGMDVGSDTMKSVGGAYKPTLASVKEEVEGVVKA